MPARCSEVVDEAERPGSRNRMSRFGEICHHHEFHGIVLEVPKEINSK